MREQIIEQIDSAKADLHNLEIERARLDARIQTLEEMLEIVPNEKSKKKVYRERQLSDLWQNILYIMSHEYNHGASYDAIIDIAKRLGEDIPKSNLRGHMGNYKQSGYVTSVRDGIFIVTDKGKKKSSEPVLSANEKTDAEASASQDLGPVTGRERGYPPSTPKGSIPFGSTVTPSSDTVTKITDPDDEIPF